MALPPILAISQSNYSPHKQQEVNKSHLTSSHRVCVSEQNVDLPDELQSIWNINLFEEIYMPYIARNNFFYNDSRLLQCSNCVYLNGL
jgi:hypothetical protein